MSDEMTALAECTFGNGTIRIFGTKWEPWFVGKDICDALGYKNHRDAIAKHVDEDDKGVAKCDTPGGVQSVIIINESGMYALIFGSELSEAKRFKRWVTHEVLPQIRKYGSYKPNRVRGRQPKLYLNGLVPRDGLVNAAASLGMRVEDARKKSADELEGFCVERGNADWVEANLDKYPYSFSVLNQCVGGFLSLVMLDVPDLEEHVLVPRRNCGCEEWCFTANFADNLETFAKKAKLSKYFDGARLEKWKKYVSAMQNGELCDISTLKLVNIKWEFDAAKYKEADWA